MIEGALVKHQHVCHSAHTEIVNGKTKLIVWFVEFDLKADFPLVPCVRYVDGKPIWQTFKRSELFSPLEYAD